MIFNLSGGGTPDIDSIIDDDSNWKAFGSNFLGIYYLITNKRIYFKGICTTKISTQIYRSTEIVLPTDLAEAINGKVYFIFMYSESACACMYGRTNAYSSSNPTLYISPANSSATYTDLELKSWIDL